MEGSEQRPDLQAFSAWHEEVVMSYNHQMATRLHRTRLQARSLQAWQEHTVGVRQQILSLQAAMLRWSKTTLASAFAAWVGYTSNQVPTVVPLPLSCGNAICASVACTRL